MVCHICPFWGVHAEQVSCRLSSKSCTVPKLSENSCHAQVSPPSSDPVTQPEPTPGSVAASLISCDVMLCQLASGASEPQPPSVGYGMSAKYWASPQLLW